MLVKVMAPDGTLGNIPEEHLQEAISVGARVMSKDDLKDMYQSIFMTHALVTDTRKKLMAKFQPRQSLRKKMRRK